MYKKGILTLLPFFVIALIVSLVSAFLPSQKSNQTNEYSITGYVVDALVKENNSIEINEKIDVEFYLASHGIFRYIPLHQNIKFEQDGKTYSKNYEIEVEVNEGKTTKFESYTENDNFVIQLGDPNVYAEANSTFNINYVISLGDDKINDFDQLYYNFIGTGWGTTISNIKINIKFEKAIENREIFFYVGTNGDEKVITKTIENSEVSFEYSNTLSPFKGITARTVLDEGYFKTEKQSIVPSIILYAIAGGALIASIVVLFINRKREKIVPIVEFSAPDGITPSDAGYIIDQKVNNGDVSALIVYWANKGFVKIDESSGQTIVSKVKDADETFKDYEKLIFNSMFFEGENFDISKVNSKTTTAITKAKPEIVKENSKYFDKSVLGLKSFFITLFAVMIAVSIKVVSGIVGLKSSTWVLVCVGVMCAIIGIWLMSIQNQRLTLKKWKRILFGVLLVCVFLIIYFVQAYFLFEIESDILLTSIFVPLILFVAILPIIFLNARTEGEKKEVGRLFGLRTFILVTEKDRIEMLAKENPEMFYNVLPYAYVLGISDVWIKKFEKIELEPAGWYVGNSNIVDIYIASRILSSMNIMSASIAKSIANSTARSISSVGKFISGKGGGMSGGGFGGGGGGRW